MRTLVAESPVFSVQDLDLSNVGRKMMMPQPEGEGWNAAQVEEATKWYLRFLEIGHLHPMEQIVPNGPIDKVWHYHILDTKAYREDCQKLFGKPLDHYPYFGLNGAEDAANRDNAFDRTNELYRTHYGEDCTMMHRFYGKDPNACESILDGVAGHDGVFLAMGCGHAGSGTGCGQGCGRTMPEPMKAQSCNSGGSGTGCAQGCSRGR